jgi:Tfp pilus assembly protein PilE
MKSDFSRFLHYILSYSGLTRISRWKKFANWFDLDTPVKPECDSIGADASTGRSMVEMLGVLAIIGILSVGAISGYSKAIMKYKLNKQSEQLTQVLNSITRLAHSFNNIKDNTRLLPYLIKMNEIPQEMIKNTSVAIYDVFNNTLDAYIQPPSSSDENSVKGVLSLFITTSITTKSTENMLMCQNIYNIIKENSGNIYYVYSSSGYGTDDARRGTFWGDNYCYAGAFCLKDLTVENLSEECSRHFGNKGNGTIVILWKM